jgi:hypothetical protein
MALYRIPTLRRTLAGAWLAALGAAVFLVGGRPAAGEEKTPEVRTFIGTLDGAPRSARIGVITDGAEFVAYVCSQDAEFNQAYSKWLKGTVGDRSRLSAAAEGVKIEAAVGAEKIEGQLEAGGKSMKFSAAVVDPEAGAGLFRAEDTVKDETHVFGWLVEEDGTVVGNVRNTATGKSTPQAERKAPLDAPKGKATGADGGVTGQAVTDPKKALPKGEKDQKYDDKKRKEIQAGIVSRLKAKGGSALIQLALHQFRRFAKGEKPVGDVEQKTFARLAKLNKAALTSYLAAWDALPADTRTALQGAPIAGLTADKPLTKNLAASIVSSAQIGGNVTPKPATSTKKITNIKALTLTCLDEVDPETFLGIPLFDHIFVVYVVTDGAEAYTKQTKVYDGFRAGISQPFVAADLIVYPPSDKPTETSSQEVVVSAAIFEDHSGAIAAIEGIIKAAVDLGLVVASIVTGEPAPAGLAPAIDKLIDAIAAAFPSSQLLGSDIVVFKTDGSKVGVDGQKRTAFDVKKTTNGAGGPYHYQIQNLQSQIK